MASYVAQLGARFMVPISISYATHIAKKGSLLYWRFHRYSRVLYFIYCKYLLKIYTNYGY